jgi:5'-deoxynucleotidase YfbR-like HD superfamily hydrolase
MEEEIQDSIGGREKIQHLQTVGHGLSAVIRYNQSRNGLGILNQSVPEHKFNMLLIKDVFKSRINEQHDVDWDKVDKMVRYHDVGELVEGDIICVNKTDADRELERLHEYDVVSDFPTELGDEIIDLLREKDELESIEARITHVLDKLEPEILIATERGMKEIKDLHREQGIVIEEYAFKKFNHLLRCLKEWDLDCFIETVEELWEKQVELGILKNDPQLVIETEEKKEEESEYQERALENETDKEKEMEVENA